MQKDKELTSILSKNLKLNKCRIVCLSKILLALMYARSVSLPKLAASIHSQTLYESCLKRLQRFFSQVPFDYDDLARLLVSILLPNKLYFQLAVDRTNWKLGRSNINILMLSIVFDGIAIPVIWDLLDKKGNSNTSERIALLNRFGRIFGFDKIDVLLCDREFIGSDWFEYLQNNGITFVIRIKKDTLCQSSKNGKTVKVERLFRCLSVNRSMNLRPRTIWGQRLLISGLRLPTGELLILVTNDQELKNSIELYAYRWEIETLFHCLKGRGFDFEATHITKPERISRLVAVLALSTVWALKVGRWANDNIKRLKINKNGRLEKSIFRYGLDYLHQVILGTRYTEHWDTFLSLFGGADYKRLQV